MYHHPDELGWGGAGSRWYDLTLSGKVQGPISVKASIYKEPADIH